MRLSQRGDTIIEVMLAFVVFGVLSISAIAVMNRGVAGAQDSLETTLVRQEMDAQAETLRFLHQAYLDSPTGAGSAARFASIMTTKLVQNDASGFGDPSCVNAIPNGGGRTFILNPSNGGVQGVAAISPASVAGATPYAEVTYNPDGTFRRAYGLWIEAVEGGDVDPGQPKFIDFHIRACWYSASNEMPRTLGTVVRLYVPAS
jgi:type II secretory pathway pseudopilin PulG